MARKSTVTVRYRQIYVDGVKAKSLQSLPHYCSGEFRALGETSDGRIVKADYSGNKGLARQTWAEIMLWPKIERKDRRYFPKVFEYGTYKRRGKIYRWLIEEKLDIDHSYVATKEAAKLIRSLKKKYKIGDVAGAAGKHHYNWGATRRGRIVIWDFGVNSENFGSKY